MGSPHPATEPLRGLSLVRLVVGVLFHSVLLALLPFLVGGLIGFFAEVSQVRATLRGLIEVASGVLVPLLVVQAIGISVKVRRELHATRASGGVPSLDALLRALHRHVRVMSDKGLGLLLGGLAMLALSLTLKFAEFGLLAVLGLTMLYLLVTLGVLLSTFVTTRFEERLATRRGVIGREFAPALLEAGDTVEERFHFENIPLPPGFKLRVHQQLPARLATESRHLLDASSGKRITLARPLRRTPRGDYFIAPADIAFTDLFGLTHIAVAQTAGARLRVLPRVIPLAVRDTRRTHTVDEGALSALHRAPTEDFFRFRDYQPGDDTRRLHWKLSLKLGRLQVRVPESVPVTPRRVRLVLDSHIPPRFTHRVPSLHSTDDITLDLVLGDTLDRLVEVWLSLARALTDRGEDVTLVVTTGDPKHSFETLSCRRAPQVLWRELGARVRWQHSTDFHQAATTAQDSSVIVVTARFDALPTLPKGSDFTWVFVPLAETLPSPSLEALSPGHSGLSSRFLLPFPPGAEENNFFTARRRRRDRRALERTLVELTDKALEESNAAEAALRARAEPFFRVHRASAHCVLTRED